MQPTGLQPSAIEMPACWCTMGNHQHRCGRTVQIMPWCERSVLGDFTWHGIQYAAVVGSTSMIYMTQCNAQQLTSSWLSPSQIQNQKLREKKWTKKIKIREWEQPRQSQSVNKGRANTQNMSFNDEPSLFVTCWRSAFAVTCNMRSIRQNRTTSLQFNYQQQHVMLRVSTMFEVHTAFYSKVMTHVLYQHYMALKLWLFHSSIMAQLCAWVLLGLVTLTFNLTLTIHAVAFAMDKLRTKFILCLPFCSWLSKPRWHTETDSNMLILTYRPFALWSLVRYYGTPHATSAKYEDSTPTHH